MCCLPQDSHIFDMPLHNETVSFRKPYNIVIAAGFRAILTDQGIVLAGHNSVS